MVVNPMNIHKILANVELSKASEYREAVQVKPQHVSLKLRVSKYIVFTILDNKIFLNKLYIDFFNELLSCQFDVFFKVSFLSNNELNSTDILLSSMSEPEYIYLIFFIYVPQKL